MKKLLPILILCFSCSLFAQNEFIMSSLPAPKTETLHSEIVGEDYKLKITVPFGHNPNSGKKYPVLYYLDAWNSSGTINEMALGMMWIKEIDPVIFVGISYQTDPFTLGNLRKRDYMPPVNEKDKKHGGEKFLQFIKTELVPFMEKNYATDPNDRGIMGASLGGLFCTYAMKKEPQLFNRLLIMCPSLWFGDEFLLKDAELADNVKNAKQMKVFLAVGELEADNMISYVNQLSNLIEKNKNVTSKKVIFDEENHGSVIIPATLRGIRFLYKNGYKNLQDEAFAFYKKKKYSKALSTYQVLMEKYTDQVKHRDHYDIACLYSLTNNSDKAFNHLQVLVDSNFKKPESLLKDADFNNLHDDKRWKEILTAVTENKNSKK